MENRRRQFNINFKERNAHNNSIFTLLNIGNKHIASGSGDKLIKIW